MRIKRSGLSLPTSLSALRLFVSFLPFLLILTLPGNSWGKNLDRQLSLIESSSGRYQFMKDQTGRKTLVLDSQTGQIWEPKEKNQKLEYTKISVEGIENNLNRFSVYVVGNFSESGEYVVNQGSTALQLFSNFGRYFNRIDWKKSKLIRNRQETPIKLRDLLIKGDLKANFDLASEDTFFIKLHNTQEENLFKNKIRIIGEVKNQGVIDYQKGMTIIDAILTVGGLTVYAKADKIKLTRIVDDKVEEKIINIDEILSGKSSKNILLNPGDVISIPSSFF